MKKQFSYSRFPNVLITVDGGSEEKIMEALALFLLYVDETTETPELIVDDVSSMPVPQN